MAAPQPGERHELIGEFGRRAYGLARVGSVAPLLLDDLQLRALLHPEAATRVAVLRHNHRRAWSLSALERQLLANSEFIGVCVQGLRVEPAAGVLGLTADGWVFDRMLLVGSHGVGGHVALWVEGIFLRTDAGLRALTLERVESPRREHADLELALCDLRVGAI